MFGYLQSNSKYIIRLSGVVQSHWSGIDSDEELYVAMSIVRTDIRVDGILEFRKA